jgi:beta-phosphoglucomutase-like phosphatase (HAD superfamily)
VTGPAGLPVTAVTFDAAGTLWDFEGAARRALDLALAELRRVRPRDAAGLTGEQLTATFHAVEAELLGKVPNYVRLEESAPLDEMGQRGAHGPSRRPAVDRGASRPES